MATLIPGTVAFLEQKNSLGDGIISFCKWRVANNASWTSVQEKRPVQGADLNTSALTSTQLEETMLIQNQVAITVWTLIIPGCYSPTANLFMLTSWLQGFGTGSLYLYYGSYFSAGISKSPEEWLVFREWDFQTVLAAFICPWFALRQQIC